MYRVPSNRTGPERSGGSTTPDYGLQVHEGLVWKWLERPRVNTPPMPNASCASRTKFPILKFYESHCTVGADGLPGI